MYIYEIAVTNVLSINALTTGDSIVPPSAVPSKVTLAQDNTQQVRIYGLLDVTTNVYASGATMTATLLDTNRNPVAGLNGIVLAFQSGSNGNYFGTVTNSFAPTPGTDFTLVLDGDNGSSHLHIEIPTEVGVRSS